jgi:hypothetical protein
VIDPLPRQIPKTVQAHWSGRGLGIEWECPDCGAETNDPLLGGGRVMGRLRGESVSLEPMCGYYGNARERQLSRWEHVTCGECRNKATVYLPDHMDAEFPWHDAHVRVQLVLDGEVNTKSLNPLMGWRSSQQGGLECAMLRAWSSRKDRVTFEPPSEWFANRQELVREYVRVAMPGSTGEESKLRALRREMVGSGCVYLIEASEVSRCKIGFSERGGLSRLSSLQTGSPVPLAHVGDWSGLSTSAENLAHRWFGARRLHGEWFEGSAREFLSDLHVLFAWVAGCDTWRGTS